MSGDEVGLDGAEATCDLGRLIARLAPPGTVVILEGPVGAGKSTLARGMIEVWTGVTDARSPTFTLVNAYPGEVFHADLYRVDAEEAQAIGLDEAFAAPSRTVVEWGDRARALLPDDRLTVVLAFKGAGRTAHLTASGERSGTLLAEVRAALRSGGGP